MQDPLHKCLQIINRATDYVSGVNSPISFQVRLGDGDWEPYLPDFDTQKHGDLETEACVPFTAVESVATQINFLKATGQLPQTHIDTLTTLGFFDTNGTFHASERFIAKLDGTSMNGTSMPAAWDAIRKFGLVPFTDWPFDDTITTWDEFYASVPPSVLAKGQQFLTLFSISYEWVINGGSGTPNTLIAHHLQQAPLCIGAPVCEPWDQEQPPTCPSDSPDHSTMVFRIDSMTHIMDHYAPFEKEFAMTYNIPYAMKGIVTVIAIPTVLPPIPQVPVSVAPTPQNVTILQEILALYQDILALFSKGRSPGSTTMLQGKKTYILGILGIVYAVTAFATGHLDSVSAVQLLFGSLAVMGLRNGVTTEVQNLANLLPDKTLPPTPPTTQ